MRSKSIITIVLVLLLQFVVPVRSSALASSFECKFVVVVFDGVKYITSESFCTDNEKRQSMSVTNTNWTLSAGGGLKAILSDGRGKWLAEGEIKSFEFRVSRVYFY
jgi:hypothetical protein